MANESTLETMDHIYKVREYLRDVIWDLGERSRAHDQSKLESPEKDFLDAQVGALAKVSYSDTEAYKALFRTPEAQEYVQHHYALNDHHPQHFANGLIFSNSITEPARRVMREQYVASGEAIASMNLMQIVEMVCDWKAASQRHPGGNFMESLEVNRARFGISDQLLAIIRNTGEALGW